jgi:hypothetical protein
LERGGEELSFESASPHACAIIAMAAVAILE